jgi:hypothetical protein
MPCALPIAVRQQIIELKTKGSSLQSIAKEQHLSCSTLYRLWQRYKAEGTSGLIPHYNNCGPATGVPRCTALIYRAAVWLKRCHPNWGAALIRVRLQERYKDTDVPAERTMQQWFRTKKLYKLKSRFPVLQSPAPWANQVHDVWQIDAKEKLCLISGQKVSYLSVVDEHSGALLKAEVFPPLPHQ